MPPFAGHPSHNTNTMISLPPLPPLRGHHSMHGIANRISPDPKSVGCSMPLTTISTMMVLLMSWEACLEKQMQFMYDYGFHLSSWQHPQQTIKYYKYPKKKKRLIQPTAYKKAPTATSVPSLLQPRSPYLPSQRPWLFFEMEWPGSLIK